MSEIEVRRIASDIDNCRVFNTTLAQPSAVHNVFIDGKYMYMYMFLCNARDVSDHEVKRMCRILVETENSISYLKINS